MRLFCMILVLLPPIIGTLPQAAMAEQTQRSSPGCTGGGKEAEELFQAALSYEHGIRNMPRDIDKAIKLYEESMKMGNPKAAINLGTLYRTAFSSQRESRQERLDYMNALYEHAIKMGCPDGYYFLAESHYNGWGVKIDQKKGDAYMKIGAEAGGLAPMYGYGMAFKEDKHIEEAKIWLHKALDGGFGLAGYELSFIYGFEKNYEMQIEVLRKGAKYGDKSCLYSLFSIYINGEDGQPKDKEYANCFNKLYDGINSYAPPPLIDNFDELCPSRPVIPYSGDE